MPAHINRNAKHPLLVIKKSRLPGAGKGLFTRRAIKKGELVVEYAGRITTWKAIRENKTFNAYVFYITRNHVIDAKPNKKAPGRYANDAKGIAGIRGVRNNAEYIVSRGKVFIRAVRNIPTDAEILVDYGKEYWDVIISNTQLEAQKQ
ncbi:MAG: SET domain-containing protein-lysine N-methyltransferase [Bacteroidota bacterium]